MHLECGDVESTKNVYIWKSLFKEACLKCKKIEHKSCIQQEYLSWV